MREATGGAYLLQMALFFVAAVMIMFVSTISYNRSFKVKNRIIEIIEKHEGFSASHNPKSAEGEIVNYLREIGYTIKSDFECDSDNNGTVAVPKDNLDSFEYCVYEYTSGSKKYYKVVTYAYFKFPIIDKTFKYKIYGETRVMK